MQDTPPAEHAPFSPASPWGARPSSAPPLGTRPSHRPRPLSSFFPPPHFRSGSLLLPGVLGRKVGGGAIRAGSRTSFGNRPWRLTRAGVGAWPPGSASGFALGGGLACLEPQHQLKWPCDRGRRPPLFHFVSTHLGLAVWHPPLQSSLDFVCQTKSGRGEGAGFPRSFTLGLKCPAPAVTTATSGSEGCCFLIPTQVRTHKPLPRSTIQRTVV